MIDAGLSSAATHRSRTLVERLRASFVLLVGHLLQPFDKFSIEYFRDGDVLHKIRWSGAMPVFLAWRYPHNIAGADFLQQPSPALNAARPRKDVQCLPHWMGM